MWDVDPVERSALVYRANGEVKSHSLNETLSGEDVLPGFSFDLSVLE